MAKCSYIILGLFGVILFMQGSEATTFTVGGSKGWTVPIDNNAVFSQWAEKTRFQIGDSLLFVYPSSSDSVLQVTKEDFTICNTNSPIAKFNDGHTQFKLDKSGPYYFISGNKDNCIKNEKLVVIVLADRTTKTVSSPPPPATPAAPAPAPVVLSPPTPTTTVVSPAPSDEATPPPRNGVTVNAVMTFGSVGALVGSVVLLGF